MDESKEEKPTESIEAQVLDKPPEPDEREVIDWPFDYEGMEVTNLHLSHYTIRNMPITPTECKDPAGRLFLIMITEMIEFYSAIKRIDDAIVRQNTIRDIKENFRSPRPQS